MPFEKQLDDNGQENPLITLARIDERTKNMNEKLTAHMVSFETHKIDDETNFKNVNRWIFIGVGVVGTLQFIGLFLHK